DGKLTTDFEGHLEFINALALQNDGKIIAVGAATGALTNLDFALVRYNSDGSVDTSFGPDGTGRVLVNFLGGDDVATGVAIRLDGSIVVGGWCTQAETSIHQFALACFTSKGLPNTAFGPDIDGEVITTMDDAQGMALGLQV